MRIAGPLTVYCPAAPGTNKEVELPVRFGGQRAGQLQYSVKVLDREDATVEVGLKLKHSPDGVTTATHSTPITAATVGTPPVVVTGDATLSTMALPYLHPVLVLDISSGSAQRWVTLEVHETKKEL